MLQLRISGLILSLLPPLLAVVMSLIEPGYFLPIWTSRLGLALILSMIFLCLLAALCVVLIVRWAEARPGKSRFAPLLMLLPMLFLIFPALWIVILGPSLLIVARVTQG